MNPRNSLDETAPASTCIDTAPTVDPPPVAGHRQLAVTDWDRPTADHLVLFLPDEPRIGDRFRYNDVQWQVVDYCDGWVARILL